MRNAHIIKKTSKGFELIGPGQADKIRAEAASLKLEKGESAILYVDGRNPRTLGTQDIDAYLALVAKENAEKIAARSKPEKKQEQTAAKPAEKSDEVLKIKEDAAKKHKQEKSK